MSIVKAILIGVLVWFLGVCFYTISYLFPFLDDQELQSNLVLALSLIPSALLGAKIYYRKGSNMPGVQFGLILLFVAILLDAIITVPYIIIPNGGNYQEFFRAIAFWLIATEYFLVVYVYWALKIKQLKH